MECFENNVVFVFSYVAKYTKKGTKNVSALAVKYHKYHFVFIVKNLLTLNRDDGDDDEDYYLYQYFRRKQK